MDEVLHSISPLCQQVVASMGRAKSVCLMAKTPECPCEPAMSLLLFGSFSAYPNRSGRSSICKCTCHMALRVPSSLNREDLTFSAFTPEKKHAPFHAWCDMGTWGLYQTNRGMTFCWNPSASLSGEAIHPHCDHGRYPSLGENSVKKKTMKKHRENEKANFRVARIWELRQLRVLNQLPSQHQCRSAKHQLFWCNLLRWGVGH